MPADRDTALRRIRSVVPLSARGLGLAVLAGALLAEGILRADLAGMFWGSSFLVFVLYAVLAGHLFLAAARRKHGISFHLPASGLFPGEQGEAVAEARLPRSLPPGFSAHLALPLRWHPRRIEEVRHRVKPGMNEVRMSFNVRHRGLYHAECGVLEAQDVLGLTRHRLRVPRSDSLVVYPAVDPAREMTGRVEQSDGAAQDSQRRRRSEELLEARKYYPGDDVRRVNWKVFAHTGELFLRIGEEVPPPESRMLFVLDATVNPRVPRGTEADYLDALVRSCASFMAHLVRRGLEVNLSRPGERGCPSFGAGDESLLLRALAATWWTSQPWTPDLPPATRQAVVFSSPGSPGLPRIMSVVAERGWVCGLYLQNLEPPAPPLRKVRDLLLLPRQARPPVPRSRRRDRETFDRALAQDLQSYGGTVLG